MKNNWIRFLAGALVSVMLVGAFALTGGMRMRHFVKMTGNRHLICPI